MSLSDFTTEHPVEVSLSEVESIRFGYQIGRCTVPMMSSVNPIDVALEIRNSEAEITVLRYPADRVNWFDLLARQLVDHVLLHADTLAYWELSVGSANPPEVLENISTGYATDAAMTGDLATRIFAEYSNHYSANPLLSTEAVAAGYREWAMRTPLPDSLILFMNGSPIGMATIETTPDQIEILLAGVIPEQRSRGLYQHILRAIESRAEEDSVSRVVISTQSHNTVVQRAWARYGFLPLATILTVHVVRADIWGAATTSSGSRIDHITDAAAERRHS